MVRNYDPEQIPVKYNLKDIPKHSDPPGVELQIFRGFNCLVGIVTIDPGTIRDPQSHPWAHEASLVLEGKCDFYIAGEKMPVEEDDLFHIPPNVDHYVETGEKGCRMFNCWTLREDYLPYAEYQEEFPA